MQVALIPAIRFTEDSQRVIPPLGLYYLSSYLGVVEPSINISVYRTPREILEAKPDIIGISAVTENMKIATDWAQKFKERLNVPVILGGNHISALPHTLPEAFDAGVIGEGEETLLHLLRLYRDEPDWRKQLNTVQGICYHEEATVRVNELRPLIDPLDRIPFPVRIRRLWGSFHYMFTSRGCPYRCIFCSPKVSWQHFRAFSASYVIKEIDSLFEEFKPSYIHFFDDLFIADRSRLREISKLIRQRGYNRQITFGGHIRANMVNDDLCKNMAKMNFTSAAFGAESGSDRILKFLKAGSTNVEMNHKAIKTCFRHGINLNISFIIGTPGETEADMVQTLRFIDKHRKFLSGLEVFVCMPYPGTRLWEECKNWGYVSDDMDWDRFYTKAFFSEFHLTDNSIYVNKAMNRDVFERYVRDFQALDAEINTNNRHIFRNIEMDMLDPLPLRERTSDPFGVS